MSRLRVATALGESAKTGREEKKQTKRGRLANKRKGKS